MKIETDLTDIGSERSFLLMTFTGPCNGVGVSASHEFSCSEKDEIEVGLLHLKAFAKNEVDTSVVIGWEFHVDTIGISSDFQQSAEGLGHWSEKIILDVLVRT